MYYQLDTMNSHTIYRPLENGNSCLNVFIFIIGLFEDDKIIYSFLLACSLGKESKGLMESEEWRFLLNFAHNQSEAQKNHNNTDATQEDADIGK